MKKTVLAVLFALLLCACNRKAKNEMVIGTLWKEKGTVTDDFLVDPYDLNKYQKVISDCTERALAEFTDISIKELPHSEGNTVENITTVTEHMVNEDNALMILGSGMHSRSMHAAAVTSFFEAPMLIPFSDGDDIIRSNNIWSYRITPENECYTNFVRDLFSADWKDRIDQILFPDSPVLSYLLNAGIIFEDTTYGHSMAVDLGQTLMDMGINLDFYLPIKAGKLIKGLEDAENEHPDLFYGLDVIFFISEHHYEDEFKNIYDDLVESFTRWNDPDKMPIFISMGHDSLPSLNGDAVPRYYFGIRQHHDLSNCPADITSYEGQTGYAAGYIAGLVLDRANRVIKKPAKSVFNFLKIKNRIEEEENEYIRQLRGQIRQELQNMNDDIPCLGNVSFVNTSMKDVPLELIIYTKDQGFIRADSDTLMNAIAAKIRYGIYANNGQ